MVSLPLQNFIVLSNMTHFTRQHFGVVCLFSFLSLSPLWTHTVVFSLYSDTPWPSQTHLHADANLLTPLSPDTQLSLIAHTECFLPTNDSLWAEISLSCHPEVVLLHLVAGVCDLFSHPMCRWNRNGEA